MSRIFFALFFTIAFMSCVPATDDLDTLADYMTGSFSSAEQAKSDTNFSDIRLQQARIWPNRTDGYWFYVEQAAAENLDRPYRQRVYHLFQKSDSLLQSTVYTLPNPSDFVGAWENPTVLAELTPEDLTEREGCAIILKKYGNEAFVGSTESLRCDSKIGGASFATSIVLINATEIYSWDRGFDMEGNQVWGARTGGYIFKKTP